MGTFICWGLRLIRRTNYKGPNGAFVYHIVRLTPSAREEKRKLGIYKVYLTYGYTLAIIGLGDSHANCCPEMGK